MGFGDSEQVNKCHYDVITVNSEAEIKCSLGLGVDPAAH